jgi:UDP-N-acetylglucosamine--N-acetylmuramyl-(pentapeptide) pyrophosphoryl-undecaprenol N-acetylglucosamine transferase
MESLNPNPRLLIAASGTGGHLFPAIAVAEKLSNWHIEWLGVPDRLEQQLVPASYPLHSIQMQGFQKKVGLDTITVIGQFIQSIFQVRRLLRRGGFDAVFTTGGYIAAPAILAARSLGLPAIIHESNAIPGKVTRWLAPLCNFVAVGFERAAQDLPPKRTRVVGTPARAEFYHPQPLTDFNIPPDAALIVVAGGSQGAVALNRFVRDCAQDWINAGAWIVHQTGASDPDAESFQHPHYTSVPFYNNMAGLLQRANLAISRAGAGTLTELAIAQTPAILIPFPFAAEDHQAFNAEAFAKAGAAFVYRQQELTSDALKQAVLRLIQDPAQLDAMARKAGTLAVHDSAEQITALIAKALR